MVCDAVADHSPSAQTERRGMPRRWRSPAVLVFCLAAVISQFGVQGLRTWWAAPAIIFPGPGLALRLWPPEGGPLAQMALPTASLFHPGWPRRSSYRPG